MLHSSPSARPSSCHTGEVTEVVKCWYSRKLQGQLLPSVAMYNVSFLTHGETYFFFYLGKEKNECIVHR